MGSQRHKKGGRYEPFFLMNAYIGASKTFCFAQISGENMIAKLIANLKRKLGVHQSDISGQEKTETALSAIHAALSEEDRMVMLCYVAGLSNNDGAQFCKLSLARYKRIVVEMIKKHRIVIAKAKSYS